MHSPPVIFIYEALKQCFVHLAKVFAREVPNASLPAPGEKLLVAFRPRHPQLSAADSGTNKCQSHLFWVGASEWWFLLE